ncbi:MAG: hypothetical protein ACKVOR_14255, partial [Flavobacteriales bacterium]
MMFFVYLLLLCAACILLTLKKSLETQHMLNRATKSLIVFACSLLVAVQATAQEKLVPLRYNPAAERAHSELMHAGCANRGGGSLALPFFDDFSRYSLPTAQPGIPAEWQMWHDDDAYINCTFPIAPLTIGVATLDGLDPLGHPYEWDEPNMVRGCDSLTSLPIDLSSFSLDDSLQLLFHFQNRGLGDLAENYDTLYLDFYTPLGIGEWRNAWKMGGGTGMTSFEQIFITLTDPDMLNNGFRFRFRNLGRPGGVVDHWHLDYIILADEIDPDAFQFDEVAFQYCNNTLLTENLTSMPWSHYLSNAPAYTAPLITISQHNLSATAENISTQVTVTDEEGNNIPPTGLDLNPSAPAESAFQRTIPLPGLVFPENFEDEATFTICAAFNQTDAHLQNDTMCFDQHFSNYYAYDDGSAETGWGINQSGGRAAMKFNSVVPDTLIGVFIYWVPFIYDYSDESFLLRVYADNAGQPGDELNPDDFSFYSYNYSYDGYNPFYYYELTTPVAIDGTFYMGWIQQDFDEVYIGNDMNTDVNTSKLFRKYNAFSDWALTSLGGTIMFRPVFRSDMPEWVGV